MCSIRWVGQLWSPQSNVVRTGTHPAKTYKILTISAASSSALAMTGIENWPPATPKWTQWIFTKLYEKGLAYEAEMLVNYCPLRHRLANEEVENGFSRGSHRTAPFTPVGPKITAYDGPEGSGAFRLARELEKAAEQLDWRRGPGGICCGGAEKERLSVYTTRPDTLSGATYMVLAPEHTLVNKITSSEQQPHVEQYRQQAAAKSDLDRTELNKTKTGVFSRRLCDQSGQIQISYCFAHYVLMGYGTGAIMAVPAHLTRDFEFAKAFHLPSFLFIFSL